MLTPGGAGAYDAGAGGVSARCVVAHPTDPLRLLMLYEALDETRSHNSAAENTLSGSRSVKICSPPCVKVCIKQRETFTVH